jgi:phosphoribosyl 1,2-cyclic phosphodiesterase
MIFSLLASGSRANSLFVSAGATSVLIDCGLSARETERRLAAIGTSASSLSAIVITHEHSDHISGLGAFARRFQIPVYASVATAEEIEPSLAASAISAVRTFEADHPFRIGDLRFAPVRVSHDAVEPVALRIEGEGSALGLFTDLGEVTPLVRGCCNGLDALILEMNHDPDLLRAAPYPASVRARIAGSEGHLSNRAGSSFLEELLCADGSRLRYVIGAHVSERSNNPSLVQSALAAAINKSSRQILEHAVASANEPTVCYQI